MSRSNGSMNTGGRPAPRTPAADPNAQYANPQHPNAQWAAANPGQYGRQPAPQADLATYQQPYRGQHDQAPADPYGQLSGYRFPNQPQADPYAAQPPQAHYPSQHGYAQPPHAHQPDPYAQHAAAHFPQAAVPQQGYPNSGYQNGYLAEPAPTPLSNSYGQPAARPPQEDPFQALRGAQYDQWSGQQAGYNHGGFAAPPQSATDWQSGAPAAYASHSSESNFDLTGYGGPHGGYEPALTSGAEQNAVATQYQDEEGEYEVEEPPRRGRATMIIAALVAAIGIGGGLAYGYKELLGAPETGSAPLVKSATGPSKVKPTNPGGKQFAHSDSKIMGRLGEEGASSSDDAGAKKVSTLTVGRDGSIVPPAATSPEPTTASATSVAVPGLMVVDAFPQRPAQPSAAPAAQPIVVNPPSAPEKPVVIAKATPAPPAEKAQPVRADTGTLDAVKAAIDSPAPVRKKVAAAAAAETLGATPAATPSGTSGYVAVLASVPASGKSRMDALKQFADMQQKYGTLLQNKTPDVQEANLGDKGTYHRLLVGPPASRDQASSLCSGLKAAGYNDCWVTAY